jgi:hypothetical protein
MYVRIRWLVQKKKSDMDDYSDKAGRINKTSIIRHFDPTGDISNYKREVRIDANLLELFFSNDDGLYTQSNIQIELENEEKINEINYIIEHMLPEIEKYVILLLFFYKKKQEVVGRILKVSQEMVCYYKKRALKRINLLYFFRNIDIVRMEEFLDKYVTKKQKIAMIEYFKDHDLRRIAKKIGKSEGKIDLLYESIGSRIKLGLKRLDYLKKSSNESLSKEASLYHQVFSLLKRYNSLYHTQSKKKVGKEISV